MSESLVSHTKAIIICLLGLWLVSGVIVYRRDTVTFTFECGNYINTVDSSNRSFEVQIYCGGIDLESVRIDSSLAFEEFFKIVNALLQILFLAILFKNANVYATLILLIVNLHPLFWIAILALAMHVNYDLCMVRIYSSLQNNHTDFFLTLAGSKLSLKRTISHILLFQSIFSCKKLFDFKLAFIPIRP